MLFKASEIQLPSGVNERNVSQSASGLHIYNQEGWKHLRKKVGNLEPDSHHHFITEGSWSAIHLFEYLVSQCGDCDVWITSWSISENAIRRMVMLHQSGVVKSLSALFDRRVAIYTPSAHQFAETHFRIKLMPIHAKISVFRGSKMSCVVNQSANYNDNKRLESGIVSTLPQDVDFYIQSIEKCFTDGER